MERKYAKFFIGLVHELIQDNGQREKLFDALRQYQTSQDLSGLLGDMRAVLDEPSRLELYDYMRPLILLHHQMAYSQRMPSMPGVKARIVRLRRRPGESLGFAVRGGLEHGVGVFVTDVKPGSQADRQGLVIGNEILAVNGFSIAEAIHDDVLNLIKGREDIVLKVIDIGMLPVKEDARSEVKWKYADDKKEETPMDEVQKQKDLKIFIDSSGHSSLGCGIVSGPPQSPGIFVEKVRPGSLAEEVNLEPGDLLLEVNGTRFHRISHKEAVLALVSSRQLHITIRKGQGLQWMEQSSARKSAAKAEFSSGENQMKQPTNQMQENNIADPVTPANQMQENDIADPVTPANQDASGQGSSNQERTKSEQRGLPTEDSKRDNPGVSLGYLSEQATRAPGFDTHSPSSSSFSSSSYTTTTAEVYPDRTFSSASSLERSRAKKKDSTSSSSPLSGAAAMLEQRRLQSSTVPTLLGRGDDIVYTTTLSNKVYDMFNPLELDGRTLHCLKFPKARELGIQLEGGLGSPLGGKVVVGVLEEQGVARQSGHMNVGDQLMAVDGIKLIGLTATKVKDILQSATAASTGQQDRVELIFCASTLVNEEESMTYF